MINIRTEINKRGNRKTILNINESKLFFLKILTKLTNSQSKKKRKQSNKIKNERGDGTTDATEIQRIIRDQYE